MKPKTSSSVISSIMLDGDGGLMATDQDPPLSPVLRSATNLNLWQDVTNNRHRSKRAVPESNSRNVRPRTESSNSQLIVTQNRFQPLASSAYPSQSVNNDTINCSEQNTNSPKPPPLFLPGVIDIKPLIDILDSTIKNNYFLKTISHNQIKIQPNNSDAYRKIVQTLNKNSVSFHTYQLKEQRSFRVVIRNLHHSISLDDLKQEIECKGHKVKNIYNIKQKITKEPLPLFILELEQNQNNKTIYNLEFLQNTRIQVEPPMAKKEIPQCSRCQRYGHTKSYCSRQPRCVKCGQNHGTFECKKDNTSPATCVLCEGNHPANYKGCSVYKEIRDRKFPPPRPRQIPVAEQPPQQYNPQTSNNVKPSTYAEAVKQSTTTENNNSSSTHQSSLEIMMSKLMDRMDTMLNILTTLITKIK